MTLLRELIDIPEQVYKSDFVISLKTAIEEPDKTIAEYVVTDQLTACFRHALGLITSAVAEGRSKATYLHASFGAGKSAFMAVTDLLLAGVPAARANAKLAPIVAEFAGALDGRRFLLVPYQAVGASSLEQIVLGGYVEYVRALHPDSPLPAVYVADGILADARIKRVELGDETFFRLLSEGDMADEWGTYGVGWDATRFEAAFAADAGSSEHDQLVSALLHTHYRAVPGQAQATSEGFVPIDDGIEAISRHAKSLGYDAVVLFLDELVLWLAARMSDVAFVSREGAKVVKLVEGDEAQRPVPIVSLIARQRDLRELVGDHVLGAESLSAIDILRHSEGRFDTITLEDRNLPAIAEQRLLRPRSEQARQQLDDAFRVVQRAVDERGETDVLLTETGDLSAFRRLYPFSPALVDALVALSGAMQRERTALKVMLQLLVDNRERLQVGQLVPLGDLFDAINAGDEPLTEVMRAQFAQARRLWTQRFLPMLLRVHQLDADSIAGLDPQHAFVTDARLVKSLLIAALVPEVGPLRGLTVSRLTALNSGIVRAFIPGTERQQVLEKLRMWAAEIGELRIGDDEHDPPVSVTLAGIDTGPIVDAAKTVDNDGERRRRVKELLVELLAVKAADSFDPTIEVLWRGTLRTVSVVFGNVRDPFELPDESLRASADAKLVIDYPWDRNGYTPNDDRARVDDFRHERSPEWTAVWLPNFLTEASANLLGRLVRLDYVLTGDTFERLAGHLSPSERPLARAQLANEQSAVRERVMAVVRQAYGVEQSQSGAVDDQLDPADQFQTLDPALSLRPPVGTSMRAYAEGIVDQLYSYRFPRHPEFTERVTMADLRHTLEQVRLALGQPNGRLENVESTMRRVLTRVAGPLDLGTMYSAHFVADMQRWIDLIERRRAESGTTTLTVGQVRAWLDSADIPMERRGLTGEVADLVILCVAAATDRTLLEAGRPVTVPDIGRLRNDWELRAQELPAVDVWDEAVRRATDMGVVLASRLRTATAVVDLTDRIHRDIVGDRAAAVRELPAALRPIAELVGVADDCVRWRTAGAAIALIDELARGPERAVAVLAATAIPTTASALGTSIAQARDLARELQSVNQPLLERAMALGGAHESAARSLRQRLTEALAADELTIALVPRLRDAERAATDLLAQAAVAPISTVSPTVLGDMAPTQFAPLSDPGLSFDEKRRIARDLVGRQLEDIRARLRADARLDLRWELVEYEADGDA
ncbi:MAG: phage resistance protein [Acidimicrobiales bacterium]|jgi:hypothetical protein